MAVAGGAAAATLITPSPATSAARDAVAAAGATTGTAYLDHPGRIALIFGSFFVLCVPLAMALFATSSSASMSMAAWLVVFQAYSILVGHTHFAVTFSIYLNSRNLEYFGSSPRNIAIYFGGPVLILAVWFLIGFLGLHQPALDSSPAFLTYLFWFAVLTKLADYLHVVRQSFGVLQLFKRQTKIPFAHWIRRAENAFFLVLMGLQIMTFAEGLKANNVNAARFNLNDPLALVGVGVAAALFVAIVAGHALTARAAAAHRKALAMPFTYFVLQTASASLPVYWSVLYLASLAIHYVEYHVIMYPRVFRSAADSQHWADRGARWLRSHRIAFYALLIAFCYLLIGGGIEHLASVMPLGKNVVWFCLNLFNGIFITHFFIEAFVWKFHLPFYRQSLAPLYFPTTLKSAGRH